MNKRDYIYILGTLLEGQNYIYLLKSGGEEKIQPKYKNNSHVVFGACRMDMALLLNIFFQ